MTNLDYIILYVDDERSNRIVFAPPLNMTMDEAQEAAGRFRRAIDGAWKEVAK